MRSSRPFSLTFLLIGGENPGFDDVLAPEPELDRLRPETIRQIWFDTPGRALRSASLALRVESDSRGMRQHATRWPGDSPLAPEVELAGMTPDATRLPERFHRAMNRRRAGGALVTVFERVVERRRFARARERSLVEVTMDSGEAIAGDARVPAREIRFALSRGRAADVFAIARVFEVRAPMRLEFASLAERGFRLGDGVWGRPAVKIVAPIRPRMNTAEAFVAIARACLAQFALNLPTLGESDDIETVHQARVAIRRLRSAISLFAPMLEGEARARLRDELKWLFGHLGAARDLDVLRESLLAAGAGETLAELDVARRRAYATLIDVRDSRRLATLLLDLAEWVEVGSWRRERDPARTRARGISIAKFAARRLGKRRKSFLSLAERFADLNEIDLHALRLETKKIRYMSEFLGPLTRGEKARRRYQGCIAAFARLQDTLGEVHDIDTRVEIDGLAEAPAPTRAPEDDARRREMLMQRASLETGLAARLKPFWELF